MKSTGWTKECPNAEGWYFWRRSKTIKDHWKWDAVFVMVEGATENIDGTMTVDLSFWTDGCERKAPKGGWWKGWMFNDQD